MHRTVVSWLGIALHWRIPDGSLLTSRLPLFASFHPKPSPAGGHE